MNDLLIEWKQRHQGQIHTLNCIAAVDHRTTRIDYFQGLAATLMEQVSALEKEIGSKQFQAPKAPLRIRMAQQRDKAEEALHELRRERLEKIKDLRILMAETNASLVEFKQRYLT